MIERIGRLLGRVGLATVMVFGLLVIAGPPLFRLWLGDQLVITRDFLLLLSLWNAFAVLQTVLWAYVIAYGIQRFTVATIAGAVANLLLSFVLIPRFGLVGAAAATLIAQLTTSNWWTLRLAIGVARSHRGTAGVGKVSTTPALALE